MRALPDSPQQEAAAKRPAARRIDPEMQLSGLNGPQREAVTHAGSPLLIVAGAGSGKPECSPTGSRTCWPRDVHPGQIIAITFTNKAAGEMKDRVAALVGRGPG
jgi:DNA helicase-2/ATP-dependent DNA helicase PcrA